MRTCRRIALAAATCVIAHALLIGAGALVPAQPSRPRPASTHAYVANDSHVNLTNYRQEGPPLASMLPIMGDKIGRAAVFGIPLQQTWSYRASAPTFYLESDDDRYSYSFTDAEVAMEYRALSAVQQARFDPMITGFNPADLNAADHVRRVIETFPGVFVGIGELSSISDPALDRLLAFAGEVGLVALVHCDADAPFARLLAQFREHPNTTIICARIGLGCVIRPFDHMCTLSDKILADPKLRHVHFDLSWSETAQYLVATHDTPAAVADLIRRYPDRFLFGTDEVGPTNQDDYLRVLRMYDALWALLPEPVLDQVRVRNYERIFDTARVKVRAWEAAHVHNVRTASLVLRTEARRARYE